MSYPGHSASDPWCYNDDTGEAAAATATAGDDTSFADMIAEYSSTDGLFELVWPQGGGGGAGGASTATVMPQPVTSDLWSPPPEVPRRSDPPSEDEMAAWLRAIVKGEELAFGDEHTVGGGRSDVAAPKRSNEASTTDEKEKVPVTTLTQGTIIMGTEQKTRKPPAAGGSPSRRSSSSQHGEAHNLTEKRRRHKINDRLRTLQQLVPGCDDKCNQASTLDQTIQYMKSLKQHVQAMSVGPARPAAPPVAMPMPPAAPMVLAPAAPAMVPLGAMFQLPGHYPAAGVPLMTMPAAEAASSLYPPAVAPPREAAAGGGAGSSAGHRQGSSSSKGKGGSRSMRRQKH